MIRECNTPLWYINCTHSDAKCFDKEFNDQSGIRVGRHSLRNSSACTDCKFNKRLTDQVEHGLGVNDHGVVVEGMEEILNYKSKDFTLEIYGADFGSFWGHGYNIWGKNWGSSGDPNECDVKNGLSSKIDVLNFVMYFIYSDIPKNKRAEVNALALQIKSPQLTLF